MKTAPRMRGKATATPTKAAPTTIMPTLDTRCTTCAAAATPTSASQPPRSPPTLLRCSLIWLQLSLIALANCDSLLAAAAAAAAESPLLGGTHMHRTARSAYYSSLPTVSGIDHVKNSQLGEQHLAAFGYRIKQKPQRFYASTPPVHSPPSAAEGLSGELPSLNLVSGVRVNICQDCNCTRINAFVAISCDFKENYKLSQIFGKNYMVPQNATSIAITLAPRTHFRLESGFFSNNKVNSINIVGALSDGEQVELTTGAFRNNFGPYPDIQMNNVFSVVVREKAFSGNGKFTVRNSNDLVLYPNAFENAKINGYFVGINDLRIEEKAFNTAQARLRIESSHIDNIYRFEASLREIRFINCTIGTINGGTFDVININSIVFEDCRIDVIKARAITEKLYSNHVSITGAIIGSIEGEAIYGSGINELILTKNKIDTIHENAIHVTAINATIAHNSIKHLGDNWLRVKEWSNIIVEKNQFGDFGRIQLEETKQPMTCRFDGNSLSRPRPGSLNITNPYCILREISVDIPCRCDLKWLHALSAHDLRSETYCTISSTLSWCFNASTFNTLKYLNEVCDDQKDTLDCGANRNIKRVDGNFLTPEELEMRNKHSTLLYYIVPSALVLAVVIVAVVLACWCNTRSHSCSDDRVTHASATPHSNEHVHEFSQADRNEFERALQLMQKQCPDTYRKVNKHVQKLLQTSLSHSKCVQTITEIENLINKQKSAADSKCVDLAAFSNVLIQHLQPVKPTAPPVHTMCAETALGAPAMDGDGFYASNSIMQIGLQQYGGPHYATTDIDLDARMRREEQVAAAPADHNYSPEHIYEEPGCPKQPLLHADYASPADGSSDNNTDLMNVYSEPISERDAHQPSPGYAACAMARPPQYTARQHSAATNAPPPSVPARATAALNLPDVLYPNHKNRSSNAAPPLLTTSHKNNNNNNKIGRTPLTNVQRIAQGIEKMPNFQLQRRNMHLVAPPVYTAPDLSRKQRQRHPIPAATEARLAAPELDDYELDMRGATALPPDTGSNHSGGSNETVKIDDVIEYADV